jgi:diguanylate cyclase (GGDEF)-like protein
MKYSGRLMLIGVIWATYFAAISYLYLIHGFIHFEVIIYTIFPYTVWGWWMGKRYDQLRYYSLRDILTSTYNRRFVYKAFPRLKQQADRNKGKFAVYVIDVNDFKQVNDTYGHTAGDLVLKTIARSLNLMKRNNDIVARWGGDEFIMIASRLDHVSQIINTRVIEDSLAELHHKMSNRVSVSIGRAVYPDDAKSLDDLIKIADHNMYELKHKRSEFVV